MRKTLIAAAASVLFASNAHAEESPYRFSVTREVPIVGIGLAGSLAILIESPPAACLPNCTAPQEMTGLDASVLGKHSPVAHRTADFFVLGLLTLPHVVNLATHGGKAALEDVAISLESFILAQGITQPMKAAANRGAPVLYDASAPMEERTSRDASHSFWSGHTASAFSLATSFAVSYWLRHPRDPWRWVVLAGAETLATFVGLLKIRAGYHYPTDIMAGAAAGIGVGVLVPALHANF